MNFLGALLTLLFSFSIFALKPSGAAAAVIAAVCYITQGQEISIGFHLPAIRLVLMAAGLRIVFRGELRQLQLNQVDRALIAYAVGISLIAALRVGTYGELIYQVGSIYNILFSYFLFRIFVKDSDDLVKVLALSVYLIIPLSLILIYESKTNHNVFSIFGGVSDSSIIRDGSIRSQGAFRSPISAGAFGATFVMLFTSLFIADVNRRAAATGIFFSTIIVVCAHSSGPILGLFLGLLSMALWPLRKHTRKVRWGIVLLLVGLQLIMKSPVWFLLGRVSDVVGGGGYHRAYLIDRFVNSFKLWWLAGTDDTANWMATELTFGGADITNQFVSNGVNAGLAGLILSVFLIFRCFQALGRDMCRFSYEATSHNKLLWGLGSTLVGNIGILFSVTYFDQMFVIWYFLLASIVAASSVIGRPSWMSRPGSETRIGHSQSL